MAIIIGVVISALLFAWLIPWKCPICEGDGKIVMAGDPKARDKRERQDIEIQCPSCKGACVLNFKGWLLMKYARVLKFFGMLR